MGIMDKNKLSDEQALTATADSTNTINLYSLKPGNAGRLWLNVRVDGTALADGSSTGTLTIAIHSSADDSTFYVNLQSPPLTEAGGDFTAYNWLWQTPLPAGTLQYVKLVYTTNTLNAGTVSAWISDNVDLGVSSTAVTTPAA